MDISGLPDSLPLFFAAPAIYSFFPIVFVFSSLIKGFFFAVRISKYVLLAPATGPFTNIKFLSLYILTTSRFCTVFLSFPIRPGKCWPFKTLDGKLLPPIDPTFRCCIDPWLSGPPRQCHLLKIGRASCRERV